MAMANVTITSPFWNRYRESVAREVIPYQWQIINDERRIEIPVDPAGNDDGEVNDGLSREWSHAVRNLRVAAGDVDAPFNGMVFQDSDVYKWLEEAAYALAYQPDAQLQALCDEVVDLIARAQQPDGYLDTPFQIKSGGYARRRRFSQIQQSHEMYVMGHYIEAGVAYWQVTGNEQALQIACRMADCLDANFGDEDGKIPGADGHPEIELALARLYEATNESRYLRLARYFIDVRGKDPDFYDEQNKAVHAEGLPAIFPAMETWSHEYTLTARPIRDQQTAVGHAVRVAYLLAGVMQVGRLTNDEGLLRTGERVWNNIVHKRMYITGGIGSTVEGEAFTKEYELPNDMNYAETCASIGLVFFARNMLKTEKNGRYADVMERALYNGIISGMQLDGKRFFYVNPLEVNPGVSGEIFGYKHVIPERPGWYACACCPPNLVRMVTSLGKYAWDEDETAVYSHLFLGQEAALGKADIRVESAYPWEGSVTYHVSAKIDELFTLAIHIPAYVKDLRVTVNGEAFDTAGEIRDGYLYISRKWGSDDQVELHFPLPVRKIYASTHVREDVGCVALMRGPVVYCFEGADNGANLQALAVKKELDAKALVCTEGRLSGLTLLDVAGIRLVPSEELYTEEPPKEEAVMLRAIPYFAWGNRGLNQMRVWMHEK